MESSKQEMFRAVYEGVTLNLEIILRILMGTQSPSEIVMTGGGAKSTVWSQIFADIYNLNIQIPNHIEEATSIGAAITAGVGLGIYDSFDAINEFVRIEKVISPIPKNVEKYNLIKPIFDDCYLSLKPIFKSLKNL